MASSRGQRLWLLLLVAVSCAVAFGIIRSPLRGVFGVGAGVAVFAFLLLRKPRTGPVRWRDVLMVIALTQLLVLLLFFAFAKLLARIAL